MEWDWAVKCALADPQEASLATAFPFGAGLSRGGGGEPIYIALARELVLYTLYSWLKI